MWIEMGDVVINLDTVTSFGNREDERYDEMLMNVFERMSRESKVTDNEISRVLSENMLDLLL